MNNVFELILNQKISIKKLNFVRGDMSLRNPENARGLSGIEIKFLNLYKDLVRGGSVITRIGEGLL